MLACVKGHTEAVQELITAGVNIDLQNSVCKETTLCSVTVLSTHMAYIYVNLLPHIS